MTTISPARFTRTEQSLSLDDVLNSHNIARKVEFSVNEGSVTGKHIVGTSQSAQADRSRAPDLRLPLDRTLDAPPIVKFKQDQRYEGVILSVDTKKQTFLARLVDRTEGEDEEVEIALSALKDDEELAKPGALFTWTIGHVTRGTTVQWRSDLRIRRFLRFTAQEIEKSQSAAKEMASRLAALDTGAPFRSRRR